MIRVQSDNFDIGAEIEALRGGRCDVGAIVSFTGTVRDVNEGAALDAFELEHYPGMTETELERIETEARARWPLLDCLIIHRFGGMAPGDNIVLVVTLSAHREAAFEAAAFIMDFLKTSAPFWKKETQAGEPGRWVDARERDNTAMERWSQG